MKTKISIIAILILATTQVVKAQWETSGNTITGNEWFGADPNSDIPVRFEHRADEDESRFEWYTHDGISIDERMRLTRLGWLGLGTTNPNYKYHIHESVEDEVQMRITKTGNSEGLGLLLPHLNV